MVAAGICCLIIQCFISATATSVWGFYLAGIFLGCGLALCTTTMISFVIRRWCKTNTGKILGFVLAANGIGSAAATQVISPIIYKEGDPFGYRNAYLLMAGVLLLVGLLVVPLIRERPDDSGAVQTPEKKAARGRDWVGQDWEVVRKRPIFYIAAGCIFLTGMSLQGMLGINAAHMRDNGITPDYVAMMLSLHSLVLAGCKFLTGVSYDRFGMRFTMSLCHIAAVVATFLLSMVSATALGKGAAAGYSVISSLAMPLETIMISLFASELFGSRAFPHTMSIFAAVNTAGYAVSNPIGNWCFDSFGSYVPVILCYGGIMLAVTVAFQIVLTVAHRDRKKEFA